MGPSQLFSVGVTQLLWVLGIRSGSVCPRSCSVWSSIYRKPLLTRGPHSCFPFVSRSGCGCCVNAVASQPTKLFCVIFYIWETLINTGPWQLFSITITQWLWVLGIRSGSVYSESGSVWYFIYGKPLLTRGPHSCFPLRLHSGCGCWVYAVASQPTKWFCVIFHIWETLINTGPWQLFSIGVTQWLWGVGYTQWPVSPRSCSVLSSIYGKPLLTRGPDSCFPWCHTVVVGVGYTQWFSLPRKWFCVIFCIYEVVVCVSGGRAW